MTAGDFPTRRCPSCGIRYAILPRSVCPTDDRAPRPVCRPFPGPALAELADLDPETHPERFDRAYRDELPEHPIRELARAPMG